MIDLLFKGIVGIIAGFVKFIFVFIAVGFILTMPFLFNGGWISAIYLYGLIIYFIVNAWKEAGKEEKKDENRN